MKKSEVAKILEVAFDCYQNVQIKDPLRMLETWSGFLEGTDYKMAMDAMKRICVREKFFPSIADLFHEIGQDWSKVK